MRILLFASTLACATIQPQEKPNPNPRQPGTDTERANVVQAQRAVEPTPKAETDAALARYTLWLAIFTGALVVVSVAQGYLILRAEGTAKTTAMAARLSADAAVTATRAFVFLSTTPTRIANEHRIMRSGSLRPLEFANFGKSPAKIERLIATCRCWKGGELELEALREQPKTGTLTETSAVWLAGDGAALGAYQVIVTATDDEIHRAILGDGVIALLGVLQYLDVFDKRHEVGFAYIMDGMSPVRMREISNPNLNYSR